VASPPVRLRRIAPAVLAMLLLGLQFGFAGAARAGGAGTSADFSAARPGTYDQTTGTGGQYVDGGNTHVVEQLEGGDFSCGNIVEFLTALSLSSGSNQTIDLSYSFDATPTGGGPVGYSNIIYAAINSGDPGNHNLDGNEAASITA